MSKRTKTQLTKDDFVAHGEDLSSGGEEEMDTPQIASANIMANRKIAGMGRKYTKKHTQVPTTSTFTAPANVLSTVELSQMKSLNANFLKSINDGINKNSVADLSEICKKYIDYINKIQNKKIEVKQLTMPKVEVKPETVKPVDNEKPNPFAMFASISGNSTTATPKITTTPTTQTLTAPSTTKTITTKTEDHIAVDDESEQSSDVENKEIQIKGPTFKIDKLPTTKNGLKFGYVPPKDEDDSDDDIEIKGPQFVLNATVSDSAFSFPKKDSKPIEEKKPTFSFGANTAEKSTLFEPQQKTTFSFGTTNSESVEDKKPASIFSSTETKPIDSKPSTGFSFGSVANTNNVENKPASTPAFSFSATTSTNSKPPAFSFNAPSNSESATANTSKPFTFGSTSKPPVLNFGTNTSASAFSFDNKSTGVAGVAGATTTTAAAASANNSNSVFNFGNTASSNSASSNPFNFGNATSNFGLSSTSSTTSSPFNFTAPAANASAITTTNNGPSSNTTNEEGEDESKELEKDTVQGNFAVVKLSEKVDVKTGEEEEETLIFKRSKISKFIAETKSYDQVGLGEFKILKNKNTNKCRILVRSEGSLNVLLNILILKEMKYEIMGDKKNILRIPSINANGELETYIARVKTQNDAEELLKTIQNCQ
jgi:nucleoporin NUP2